MKIQADRIYGGSISMKVVKDSAIIYILTSVSNRIESEIAHGVYILAGEMDSKTHIKYVCR